MMDNKIKSKNAEISIDVEYKIQNVVATVSMDLEDKLDLVKIHRKYVESEYNPERFPGVILRNKDPKATFLIFASGKMVVTGLKDEKMAKENIRNILRDFSETMGQFPDYEITIQNVVASGNINQFIDLNMGAIVLKNCMYEPEVFPGLIYNIFDPKCTILVFSTGSLVCTGAKSGKEIATAIDILVKKLKKHNLTKKDVSTKEFDAVVEDLTFI